MARTVDVYFKGHDKGLGLAIKDAKAELDKLRDTAINVRVDVDDAKLTKLKGDLDALSSKRVRVGVDVDAAALTTLKANLNTLGSKSVRVKVDVDGAAQVTKLRQELAALSDKSVTVRVRRVGDTNIGTGFNDREVRLTAKIVNIAAVEAQLTALTRDRTVDIRLNINQSQLQVLGNALSRLASIGGSLGGGALSSVGSMLGGIVSAAGSAVGALAMVTTAASAAAVAAGAVPLALAGAMGAVTAAAGAMAAGVTGGMAAVGAALAVMWNPDLKAKMDSTFEGIKGHMKEIANRLAPAMSRMFDALHPAFDRLAPSLERITDGVSGLIDHLSGKLPEIADQLGPALEKAFAAGVPHIKNLINNLPRLTEAFGNFMSQFGDPAVVEAANRVWSSLPGAIESVGEAIPKVAKGFNDLMGWIDAGNLDPFIQGFKDLWNELSSADWSGTIDSIANLANTWGEFMSSIDGQSVADGITVIATALDGVLTAGMAVKNTLDGIWDTISPKNVAGEFRELAHAMLGMIRDTFGNLPFIGDDIRKAVDAALGKLGNVKLKIEPDMPKVFKSPDAANGPKIKVTPEIDWSGAGTKGPGNTFKSQRVTIVPEVAPFKLDIPPKQKVLVDVEQSAPFKLDIPPKQKVLVEVEQAAGFKLDIPPKQKVLVEPDPSGFFNFAPPQPPPVKVKVLADTSGLSADIDAKTKVYKTVEVPLKFGPLPPMPTPPTGQAVEIPLQFGPLPALPAIPPPPPVPITVDISQALAAVGQMGAAGAAAGQAFASGVGSASGAVSSAAAGLGAAAQSAASGFSLYSEGAAMGSSFARGLSSAQGEVASAARSLGATAKANKGYYRGLKGMAADRVMLVENGQAMVGGFVRGLRSQRAQVIDASRTLARDVRRHFDADVAPRIGVAGRVGVEQNLTVHVTAGVGGDPVRVGQEIRKYLDGYVQAVGTAGQQVIDV
ncbi:hypothetical protein [Rhodococcus ruber]|uniref:hypothetical protein n=1 Tax=Rhodococcus ruber TaxID=1830 RepID=UPI00265F57FA|nr:hypothetical protein [Rhodococcus ruber]MDO1481407.1 hypothetical protein [Rhodococcus ruber]